MAGKKAVALNMIANTLSFAFATLISLYLTPYITEHVGIEAYGLVSLANSFISYIVLFTAALNSMASRFIIIEIHKNEYRKANEYFSSVLIANTIIALLLIIPSVWLIFNLDLINVSQSLIFDAQITFSIVIFSFFVSSIGSFFGVVLYAKNLLYKGAFRTMESNIIRIVLILLLFSFLDTRIFYVALATFVAGLYPLIWNMVYTHKHLPDLKVSVSSFSIASIKELIASGIWNSVTKLSQILLDGLDLLLCNIYISGVMTGNVAIAKTLPGLFIALIAILSDSFFPQFLESYSKKCTDTLMAAINNSINILSAISGVCLSILIVYSRDFYRLWLPGENSSLLSILTILSLGTVLVSSCIYSLYSVFALTNKVKTNSVVMVISGFLSIGTTYICLEVTSWGVYAIVGVSSVIGIFRNLIFTPIYSAHCLGLPKGVFYKRIVKNLMNVGFILVVALVVRHALPVTNWTLLLLNFSVTGILGLILSWFFIFTKEQRNNLLISGLSKLRKQRISK